MLLILLYFPKNPLNAIHIDDNFSSDFSTKIFETLQCVLEKVVKCKI